MGGSRVDYENAVRDLRELADVRLSSGESDESVARDLVARRNRLKVQFRTGLAPDLLRVIEARNRARYGNPLGPTADALYARYGTWREVIAAAGRPADLSGSTLRPISDT